MDWRSVKFDWNRARAFLVTAEEGSLSAAARALGMAQPTLGRQVDALEEELGVVLFERAGRGLTLTPAGLELLDHVRAMGEAAGRVSLTASGQAQSIEGTICITASEIYSAYLLPPIVARLRREQPGIEVEIVASNAAIDLKRREADIAIGLERPDKGRLYSRKLTDYTLHVYGSRRYLEENGPVTSRQDFARHPLIGYIPELIFTPELDYLGQIGDGLAPRLSSTNLFAQFHATRAGAGLCILPDFMAAGDTNLVPVLPGEVALVRTFWIIAHLDARDSARIQAVMSFIADEVAAAKSIFMRSADQVDQLAD